MARGMCVIGQLGVTGGVILEVCTATPGLVVH